MISSIQKSLDYTLGFLERFVAGIPAEMLTAQRAGAINHPLWTLGHLAYSFQMIGGELALEPWLPERWKLLFGPGSKPSPDAGRYPPFSEVRTALQDAGKRLRTRLESLTPAELAAPMPDERFRALFPTIADIAAHVIIGHTAQHVGQLMVWRRVVGLPPLGESFI